MKKKIPEVLDKIGVQAETEDEGSETAEAQRAAKGETGMMIALLDTSEDLRVCAAELGCEVEQLITPLTRFLPQFPEEHFSVDNGMFAKGTIAGFLSLLEREKPRRHLCRWVCVPDVVGSARRTRECFEHWRYKLSGWPLALVMQDGQEELDIPWDGIAAIFIGGSTAWKLSKAAADCIRAGKIMGKWVHAGRVNTPARFEYFEELGADSIDGTGLSRFSWMRERIHSMAVKPGLFDGTMLPDGAGLGRQTEERHDAASLVA
jgi:hypothetical protein